MNEHQKRSFFNHGNTSIYNIFKFKSTASGFFVGQKWHIWCYDFSNCLSIEAEVMCLKWSWLFSRTIHLQWFKRVHTTNIYAFNCPVIAVLCIFSQCCELLHYRSSVSRYLKRAGPCLIEKRESMTSVICHQSGLTSLAVSWNYKVQAGGLSQIV